MSEIVRVIKKPVKYTVTDNEIINNRYLSWEARGMLIYLLSKPDDWQVRVKDLVDGSPAGVKKVRRIIKELEEQRYLLRERTKTPDGKWNWVSFVFDEPYTPKGNMVGVPSSPFGKTVTARPKGLDIVSTEQQNTNDDYDKELGKLNTLYTQGIFPITAFVADAIADAVEDFGYEIVKSGITNAAAGNGSTWNYVKRCIENVKKYGPDWKPKSTPQDKPTQDDFDMEKFLELAEEK